MNHKDHEAHQGRKKSRLEILLPALPRTVRLIWESAPGWTAAWFALLVLQGFIPALLVALTKRLVDQSTALLKSSPPAGSLAILWPNALPFLLLAAGLATLLLLDQVFQALAGWVQAAQSEQVGLRVSTLIFEKSSQVDYSFYETPAKYDQLHRAQDEAEYRPLAVMESLGMLAQGSVTLLAMAALLLPYGPWLPAALLVSSLPVFWVVLNYKRRQHAWRKRVSPQERRGWYCQWVLTAQETAAELRLFGLGPFFIHAYRALRQSLARERIAMERDHVLAELAAGVIGLVTAGACLAVMVWRALHGLATFGDLVLFYGVFSQGQSVLRGLLRGAGQLYGSMLFISNLFDFLDLPNEQVNPAQLAPHIFTKPLPVHPCAIQVENITFAYPGSERPVLSDFSLSIPAGQITAIVGDNGAGKSTLIKLLCRLYDPQCGRITWDGADLRDLPLADLRAQVSALFQQPVQYQATAAENIAYSALDLASLSALIPNPAQTTHRSLDLQPIHAAATAATADPFLSSLPHGYSTHLGKWFEDGTDLSVGQWQRVALARALYHSAPLLLLDEPTSAMDAWTEAEWLGRLRQVCAGRTVLLITHRLVTAMHADVIHVMVAGQVVESGSHVDLLRQGGRYAQAWEGSAWKGSGWEEVALQDAALSGPDWLGADMLVPQEKESA